MQRKKERNNIQHKEQKELLKEIILELELWNKKKGKNS